MGAKGIAKQVLKLLQRQKWAAPVIGIAAIAVIIWFLGPRIHIGGAIPLASAGRRLALILAVIAVWGGIKFFMHYRAKRANRAMAEDLVSARQSAQAAGSEEIAALKEHFEAAVAVLKKSRVKGTFGNQFLYELPWYIIIGPPGSGKTTALLNSGLDFPLAERLGRDPVRGVGGTRNCDWWFTNEAVLVDTAGRYTTQDSHRDTDAAAWKGFLALLKKYRPRRPINGILVAVPLPDLMVQSADEREHHSRTIRHRIKELYEHLGVQVPVYVMFTKTDLVAGFMEFFDDLGKEQRAQVWGMTFGEEASRDPQQVGDDFSRGYEKLVVGLNNRMLWRLNQERDPVRRTMINGFPQQMAGLKETLADFIQKTFAPSRFETPSVVRGVYFSSGTQEGAPIDRVMAALSQTFGLDRRGLANQRASGRSYFLTRLLRDVIFAEADLVGSDRRFERQLRWMRFAAYAGIAALAVGIVFAWSVSFTRNESMIGTLENRVKKYNDAATHAKAARDVAGILPALEYARDVAQVYGDNPDQTPWLMGMGLYQGYELGNAARDAYQRVLQMLWLPYIKADIEQYMRSGSDHPNELRRALNIYLMLGHPDTLDRKALKRWVQEDMNRRYGAQLQVKQQLEGHLQALVAADLLPQHVDKRITADARRIVCSIPLADQIYARLQEEADAADIEPFDLDRLSRAVRASFAVGGGPNSAKRIPSLYTNEGYHKIVKDKGLDIARDTIVEERKLCADDAATADADPEQLLRQVRAAYIKDYIDKWHDYLRTINLVAFSDMNQGLGVLKDISGGNSPLLLLLGAVDKETYFGDLGDALQEGTSPTEPVNREFRDLHQLLQAQGKDKAPIEATLGQLGELYNYIYNISDASRVNEAAFLSAKQRMGGSDSDIIAKLRQGAHQYPDPVGSVIKTAATQSWGQVLISARAYVNDVWRSSVLPECQRAVEGRYPMSASNRQEITLSDFGHFFGADGTMEHFINDNLGPFVQTRSWQPRVKDDHSLSLSNDSLVQFRHAAWIRSVFFQDGGQVPALHFSMKPVSLSAAASQFRLEMDGQNVSYRHGPAISRRLTWPGSQGPDRARIVFDRINGGSFSTTKDGPWAWFRLLDESRVRPTRSGDRLRVTFRVSNLTATYELQASSVDNPFRTRDLVRFSCPGHL